MQLSDEKIYKQLYQAALKYLARREYSVQELKQKLKQKYPDSPFLTDILLQLTEKKLLCNRRFAESYLRARLARGYGPVRIQHELQQRDIDNDCLASLFAEAASLWISEAKKVRRKKFGKLPTNKQEKVQQMQFLRYRGFSQEQIKMVFCDDDEC